MNPREFGRIGVLAGGPSNEREISLQSGEAVYKALKEAGADAVFLDIKREVGKDEVRRFGIDMAFVVLHGRFGEDGAIQKMLEESDIPYTGSGPLASRLALDKIASREIFIKNGIDVPRYVIARRPDGVGTTKQSQEIASADFVSLAMTSGLNFPLVVKPQFEGSSIGISIVKENKGLRKAAELAFNYGDKIIIEEYIKGKELTVGILDNEPLPVIEIVVKEQFYNFKAKYKRGDTEYIIPADINPKSYEAARAKGRLAHRALGCESFSRVDMIMDERQDRMFMLEVNSIPGFTSHSLLPKAAAYAGINFNQLCLRILESALNKKGVNKVGKETKVI